MIKIIMVLFVSLMLLNSCVNTTEAESPDDFIPGVDTPDIPNTDITTPDITPPEYSYILQEVTYSEPHTSYSFSLTMDYVKADFASYYFETVIDTSVREACIEATEKILAENNTRDFPPKIYIFSSTKYNANYISNHRLYSSIKDWKSTEWVTDVLLAVYGESVHYGTAFGYANYLCQKNGWENTINGAFSQPDIQDVYDLNLLCFNESFTTENDITVAKSLSCDFVNLFIGDIGEASFKQALLASNTSQGMELLNARLENYYHNNGVYYTPSKLRFGYGGKTCDYIVFSDLATFYFKKGWKDSNAKYNPLISSGFLHSNYSETKFFFETNLKQMQQYQDLFDLKDYKNNLSVIFISAIAHQSTHIIRQGTIAFICIISTHLCTNIYMP